MSTPVRISSLLKSCHNFRTHVRHISSLHHRCVIRQSGGHELSLSCASNLLLSSGSHSLHQQRVRFSKKFRSEKKGGRYESDSDDDDASMEKEEVVKSGYSDGVVVCNGLRIDAIAKSATNLPRHKIEEAFFEGRIRLNGAKVVQKSALISESDELDLIKGRNKDNNDFLDVYRMEIRSIPDIPADDIAKIRIKVRRFKHLQIPNYDTDPWNGTAITEE